MDRKQGEGLNKQLLKQLKQILIERLESQINWEENPAFKELYLIYWMKLTSDACPLERLKRKDTRINQTKTNIFSHTK
ncbi:hypothetical protein [Paenibacillus xylanivorans]|uniref:Uncharacterized protein n=1 Tax=Paenibacillus xylanivorans TaxID=1705561 RepID=A0A0N0C3W3_9BACL|nr:hypothetical protein [Paenibacillus xylanivorans]KOY14864.1 hypothetical protein AMS66_18980 [Paenibacillus xylanivorans]